MNLSNWNELYLDLLLTSDYLQAWGHLLSTQSQTCPSTAIPDSHNKHILNLLTLDSAKKVKLEKKEKKRNSFKSVLLFFYCVFISFVLYIDPLYTPQVRTHAHCIYRSIRVPVLRILSYVCVCVYKDRKREKRTSIYVPD